MIDRTKLMEYAAALGVPLDDAQLAGFDCYAETLVDWNTRMNLTAITAPDDIVVKHFTDSLTLLAAVDVPQGARLIDVGTGAGFPAVAVKLARPDLRVTLLDSLGKRVTFLSELSARLGQENDCVHARAEDAGREPARRERYDVATARAVAHLRELCEYCLPFVRVGGVFAALKAGDVTQELAESEAAIRLLGARLREQKAFTLPDGSRRTVLVLEKISQTSPKYPRPHAKMAKNPLA